jgi:glucosyl-dolichyl phosphate glucuronosyltransferase
LPSIRITVAIPTRNRCGPLGKALASLARMAVPNGLSWEVIVVNNGSQDATASTIETFASVLPLRAVAAPEVGKSQAMNAAVRAAHGDYLLWLDDDVLVDAGWLHAYHEAFFLWPETPFFGGPITPVFEGARPPWLDGALRHVGNAYAALDLGDEMIALQGDALPFGANWAVRLDKQREHLYDPRLGRRGELLLAGEEWAVMHAILKSGLAGRWVPAARVQHVVPQTRQSLRFLRNYYMGNGTSLALVRSALDEAMLLGRPRWVWREAFAQEFLYRFRRLYATSGVWSEHLRRASVAWGMLRVADRSS